MQACPYDAIYIDKDTNTAAKCNFCAHRVDNGLEPACVTVCPTHSIWVGDLEDPDSGISQLLPANETTVRAPEQRTGPNVHYVGASDARPRPAGCAGPRHLHLGPARRPPAAHGRGSARRRPHGGDHAEHGPCAALGLAGGHLPVDQGPRRGRAAGHGARGAVRHRSGRPDPARTRARGRRYGGHRRAAGLGPEAPRAVLLPLDQGEPDLVAGQGRLLPDGDRGRVRGLAARADPLASTRIRSTWSLQC